MQRTSFALRACSSLCIGSLPLRAGCLMCVLPQCCHFQVTGMVQSGTAQQSKTAILRLAGLCHACCGILSQALCCARLCVLCRTTEMPCTSCLRLPIWHLPAHTCM